MKRKVLSIVFVVIVIFGCKKDDNPTEPIGANSIWYDGISYPVDSLQKWGFGITQLDYNHNDTDYSWYIDQGNTGYASSNNCGPTSVTMAAKWFDKNFSKTVEEARNTYPNNGGWWYTNNIIDYLNKYSIYNSTVSFRDSLQLTDIIKSGNIFILCINTQYLKYNSNQSQRINRFYSYGGGHFILIKGVRNVDNKLLFEAYDPNSINMKYSDNSLKGKNRHYSYPDLSSAIKQWWNYIIVISKNRFNKNIDAFRVNTKAITHAWGR